MTPTKQPPGLPARFKLDEVGVVLDTLAKAAQAGELDKAIDAVTKAKAAKAAA